MAVLDVTIPTGYIIQQQYLDAYVLQRTVPNLQRARFFPGKLLFYFDYVIKNNYLCIYLIILLIKHFIFNSWMTQKHVLNLQLKDGTQLLICLDIFLSVSMITMHLVCYLYI